MSKKATDLRGKGKQGAGSVHPELAKIASEVLHGQGQGLATKVISAVQQAISGGRGRATLDAPDVGAQVVDQMPTFDQAPSPDADVGPQSASPNDQNRPGHFIPIGSGPGPAGPSDSLQDQIHAQGPPPHPPAQAGPQLDPGGADPDALQRKDSALSPHAAAANLHAGMGAAAATASAAAAAMLARLRAALSRNVTPARAATAATAAVLIIALVIGAAGLRAARAAGAAATALSSRLDGLEGSLDATNQAQAAAAAATAAELRGGLRDLGSEQAALLRRLDVLAAGLTAARTAAEAQAAELQTVRHALNSDPMYSIADNVTASEGAATGGDSDLRGLPACHLRRVSAAWGPVLPARVSAHTAVVGDEAVLMRFHAAMSAVFSAAPAGGGRLHPLARAVAHPTSEPLCLPLEAAAAAAAAAGGTAAHSTADAAGGYGSVELELKEPAAVAAISFRYPAFDSWEHSTALRSVSVTLHEAPAAAGKEAAAAGKEAAAAGGAAPTERLASRTVELAELAGAECQARPLPAPPEGSGPALVHSVTLHVHSTFGGARYACVPRVLLHGPRAPR